MKAAKILAIALCGYVGIVVAFESLIGFFQPAGGNTLVITTTNAGGNANDRVVSRITSGGQLYVAANHWPRIWYKQALANPSVRIAVDGGDGPHQAVPVTDDEHVRVDTDNPLPFAFRVLTGFPPRYFLRLEPL